MDGKELARRADCMMMNGASSSMYGYDRTAVRKKGMLYIWTAASQNSRLTLMALYIGGRHGHISAGTTACCVALGKTQCQGTEWCTRGPTKGWRYKEGKRRQENTFEFGRRR